MAFVIRSTLFIFIAIFVAAVSVTRSAHCAPSEPFGSHTVEVTYSPLVEKWLATIRKLGRDHALIGACVDSNMIGCTAARQLQDIIEDAKAQDGLALIGHINRAINFEIKPVAPSDWLSPLEAINGNGDCKAYSIAKYFALLEAGIAADHLRLVIVHARGQPGNHMVVAALWQDHWFILDNLTLMLVPDDVSEYVPLLVLDDKGMRSYVAPAVDY
jgi:predicted transglutaminase-like cysteine proteinase